MKNKKEKIKNTFDQLEKMNKNFTDYGISHIDWAFIDGKFIRSIKQNVNPNKKR